MAKIHELGFELLPHPPHSPDLAPSDYFLFADLKRMLAGKKFKDNEGVIAKTETYFDDKEKSYYKVESKSWKSAIIAVSLSKETILNKQIEFCQKNVLFCVSLDNFQPTC